CRHNTTAKQRRKLHQKLAARAAGGPIQTVVAVRVVLAFWRCATRPLAMSILLLSSHLLASCHGRGGKAAAKSAEGACPSGRRRLVGPVFGWPARYQLGCCLRGRACRNAGKGVDPHRATAHRRAALKARRALH